MKKGLYSFLFLSLSVILFSCQGDKEADTGKENQQNETDTTDVDDAGNDTAVHVADTVVNENKQVIIDDTKGSASATKVEQKLYDLTEYGYKMTIELPEGVKITKTELDEAMLEFGTDFVLLIGESFDNSVAERKAGFKNNMHNQVLGYLVDEADGFVVKMKSNGQETHNLYYLFEISGMKVQVENAQGRGYSKAEIMAMQKAVKTIKILK
jgi:hypothetical protein